MHHQKLRTFVKTFTMQIVDCSGDWATPRGSAFQMRPCSEAKRLIERPQESAQSERKSTPSFGDGIFNGKMLPFFMGELVAQ